MPTSQRSVSILRPLEHPLEKLLTETPFGSAEVISEWATRQLHLRMQLRDKLRALARQRYVDSPTVIRDSGTLNCDSS